MLVVDNTSIRKNDIVKDKIKKYKTNINMIPSELTRYLQPLDASINNPFNNELEKRCTKFCIDQKDTEARVTQENMINWVVESFYDDK